jgi:hypothetical protein
MSMGLKIQALPDEALTDYGFEALVLGIPNTEYNILINNILVFLPTLNYEL